MFPFNNNQEISTDFDLFWSTDLTTSPQTPLIGWTTEEDEKLIQLINQGNSWEEIVQQIPGRSVEACQERWRFLQLNLPDQNPSRPESLLTNDNVDEQANKAAYKRKHPGKSDWTPEENERLYKLVKTTPLRGDNKIDWKEIVKHFPGRPKEQCQHYWNQTLRKRLQKQELMEKSCASKQVSQIASQAFPIPPSQALNPPANINYSYQTVNLPIGYPGSSPVLFPPNMGYPYQAFPLPTVYPGTLPFVPAANMSYPSNSAPPSKEETVSEAAEKEKAASQSDEEELAKCLLFIQRELTKEDGVSKLVKALSSLKRKPAEEGNGSEGSNKVARTEFSLSPHQALNQQTIPPSDNGLASLEKEKTS